MAWRKKNLFIPLSSLKLLLDQSLKLERVQKFALQTSEH